MSLESYRSPSRTGLILRFVAIGAVAGIAACLLVVALSQIYDIAPLGPTTYLFASIRGFIPCNGFENI